MQPIKVLGMGDSHLLSTGYANNGRYLFRHLASKPSKWDVHYQGWHYSGQPIKNATFSDGEKLNYTIYSGGQHPWGVDVLQKYINQLRPDIWWCTADTFMMIQERPFGAINNWITRIKFSPTKTVFWFPSDGVPFPKGCDVLLKKMNYNVAYSRFAQEQVKNQYGIDTDYIPLMTDTNIFFKMKNKELLKRKWTNKIHDSNRKPVDITNKKVCLCVARNQGRKMLDRVIKCAVEFFNDGKNRNTIFLMKSHPTDPASAGVNLMNLARMHGVADKICWTYSDWFSGFTIHEMREIYNLADTFILPTCFTPETPVQTKYGVKDIDELIEGEEVLTKSGEYHEIKQVNMYPYEGKILKIKCDGLPEIKCTPNHKIFFMRRKNGGSYHKRKMLSEQKINEDKARILRKGDYVLFPIPKKTGNKKTLSLKKYKWNKNNPRIHGLPKNIKLDKEFGLLSGWYLAEGCGLHYGLALAFNTKEKNNYDLVNRLFNKLFSCTTRISHNTRNRTTLWINNTVLGRVFMDLFGHGAHNKKLPSWIINSPIEYQEGLLEGLFKGDGCHWQSKGFGGNVFELQTVSRTMAWDVFKLLIQLGFKPTFAKQQRQSMVYKIRLNGKQGFGRLMDIETTEKQNNNRIHKVDGYVIYPISRIKEERYNGLVYDLVIKEDHSYTTVFVGHNSGEGWGIPFVEAMSCELPILATDYTTPREIVDDDERQLIKLGTTITGTFDVERGLADITDMNVKLQTLIDDENLCKEIGRTNRQKALREYSTVKVLPIWEQYLKKVMYE